MKKLLIIPMLFMCSMVIGQSKKIIGNSVKIENLEVAQNDFPKEMNWKDAKAECAKLGKGWRLPTKDELNIMYENKDKIGGFGNSRYWSSTEYNNNYAWSQVFDNGKQNNDDYKGYEYDVRAVRGESSPMKTEQKAPKQIIGKPIRLQKFEVAQHDFPESMYWGDAKAACADLGAGWRLPTKDELNVMYKNKKKIDGFADGFYWSSTEFGSDHMRALGVGSGNWLGSHKGLAFYVRAVWAF